MGLNENRVKRKAADLGFTHSGIATARPLDDEADRLREWIDRGLQADMEWMVRNEEKRKDPALVLPGVRSIVCVAMNYYVDVKHSDDQRTGKISRYAWGDDYHELVGSRIEQLASWMEEEFPACRTRTYVDTGPIMEKAWAQRVGIGWIGKHSNLITQDRGSWVFLGEVLTTLELSPDQPATDHCGTCTLCIDACPTNAIVEPYVVDSHRCLSYLTIEHRGEIGEEFRDSLNGWIYGCDICQEVCPWNQRFAAETQEPGFHPRDHAISPVLDGWAEMTAEEFQSMFKGSPIKRTKHEGLVRNVRAAQRIKTHSGHDPF
jgi:epoxyqueuosine reductase